MSEAAHIVVVDDDADVRETVAEYLRRNGFAVTEADGGDALDDLLLNTEKIADLAKVNTHLMSLFVYFLERLHNTMDGDASLLDRTMIVYGSPMADGNLHNHRRCPLFVVIPSQEAMAPFIRPIMDRYGIIMLFTPSHLDGQPDFNRVWPGSELAASAEQQKKYLIKVILDLKK